eukprot:TRINITY_DN19280_c0_g2_i6.p1 TRINITY_DN19280_c0_g2~~TRINITY_DN19280_c0_g2_i6.p1  ORF type:complete len:134 (+),score=20.60 TRINITY_DN19280_c0_g2_i6:527-928(+)
MLAKHGRTFIILCERFMRKHAQQERRGTYVEYSAMAPPCRVCWLHACVEEPMQVLVPVASAKKKNMSPLLALELGACGGAIPSLSERDAAAAAPAAAALAALPDGRQTRLYIGAAGCMAHAAEASWHFMDETY